MGGFETTGEESVTGIMLQAAGVNRRQQQLTFGR
jgi:hypothetical protein